VNLAAMAWINLKEAVKKLSGFIVVNIEEGKFSCSSLDGSATRPHISEPFHKTEAVILFCIRYA
jgi:hypothetical protein